MVFAEGDGEITVSTFGSDFDTVLAVYGPEDGSPGFVPPRVGCQDDFDDDDLTSDVTFDAQDGELYWGAGRRLCGGVSDNSEGNLKVTALFEGPTGPANDDRGAAEIVPLGQTLLRSNSVATSGSEPSGGRLDLRRHRVVPFQRAGDGRRGDLGYVDDHGPRRRGVRGPGSDRPDRRARTTTPPARADRRTSPCGSGRASTLRRWAATTTVRDPAGAPSSCAGDVRADPTSTTTASAHRTTATTATRASGPACPSRSTTTSTRTATASASSTATATARACRARRPTATTAIPRAARSSRRCPATASTRTATVGDAVRPDPVSRGVGVGSGQGHALRELVLSNARRGSTVTVRCSRVAAVGSGARRCRVGRDAKQLKLQKRFTQRQRRLREDARLVIVMSAPNYSSKETGLPHAPGPRTDAPRSTALPTPDGSANARVGDPTRSEVHTPAPIDCAGNAGHGGQQSRGGAARGPGASRRRRREHLRPGSRRALHRSADTRDGRPRSRGARAARRRRSPP